jgi:peptidoglycan/LPS O-acetylase OafA/YrhL
MAGVGLATLKPGDLLHAVTYTTNYHYDRAWDLGHMWSLSVEEQFYLAWPLTVLAFGGRSAGRIALGVTALAPVIRLVSLRFHIGPQAGIGESFQTVADAIAIGCVLACFIKDLEANAKYVAFQRSPAFILVPLFALVLAVLGHHGSATLDVAVGESCLNTCIALILHYCIRYPDGRVGKFLNLRPIAYVGSLSYSLYLWQQLFFNRHESRAFASFPLNVALAFTCAVVSFHFVEKPFLRLRERIEAKSRAPGRVQQPAALPTVPPS